MKVQVRTRPGRWNGRTRLEAGESGKLDRPGSQEGCDRGTEGRRKCAQGSHPISSQDLLRNNRETANCCATEAAQRRTAHVEERKECSLSIARRSSGKTRGFASRPRDRFAFIGRPKGAIIKIAYRTCLSNFLSTASEVRPLSTRRPRPKPSTPPRPAVAAKRGSCLSVAA